MVRVLDVDVSVMPASGVFNQPPVDGQTAFWQEGVIVEGQLYDLVPYKNDSLLIGEVSVKEYEDPFKGGQ